MTTPTFHPGSHVGRTREERMDWTYDDGGRAAAGYKGTTADCVVRAIAIATGEPYADLYRVLNYLAKATERPRSGRRRSSSRTGLRRRIYEQYLFRAGWKWIPTMQVGQGCTVHLRAGELPQGRLIARLSHHLVAVVDGVVHDTSDPSRDGTRCVYGYYQQRS